MASRFQSPRSTKFPVEGTHSELMWTRYIAALDGKMQEKLGKENYQLGYADMMFMEIPYILSDSGLKEELRLMHESREVVCKQTKEWSQLKTPGPTDLLFTEYFQGKEKKMKICLHRIKESNPKTLKIQIPGHFIVAKVHSNFKGKVVQLFDPLSDSGWKASIEMAMRIKFGDEVKIYWYLNKPLQIKDDDFYCILWCFQYLLGRSLDIDYRYETIVTRLASYLFS